MRRPASTPSAAEPLRIVRIGAEGDGIGTLADGRTVFVPFTLPGEVVEASVGARRGDGRAAQLVGVRAAAADRIVPPCPHFGACGGCSLQHWADDSYAAWKAGRLVEALSRAGFADAPVAPLVRTAPAARRRMDLAVRREGREVGGREVGGREVGGREVGGREVGGRMVAGREVGGRGFGGREVAGPGDRPVTVGLHARRGAEIVDLTACPVLHRDLFALLAPLREVLAGLAALRREGSAVANLLDSGPDLLLRTDAALTAADRAALAAFAGAHGVPRIAWTRGDAVPETACQWRAATTRLGGVEVQPPPGAFLQASAAGEAAITECVLAGLPAAGRKPVVELFAGCGTLTFPLAERFRVRAFEGDAAALACLRRGSAGRQIEAVQRDLARQPLQPAELAGAPCVVLDPPFAGAAAQMAPLAQAGAPVVIYVSCNPAALARDAAVLRQAGYAVARATPIDQFLWSARLESVVVFARHDGRRSGPVR